MRSGQLGADLQRALRRAGRRAGRGPADRGQSKSIDDIDRLVSRLSVALHIAPHVVSCHVSSLSLRWRSAWLRP